MASQLNRRRQFPSVVYGRLDFKGWPLYRLKRKQGSDVLNCIICHSWPRRPCQTHCGMIACDGCLFKWFKAQGLEDSDKGLLGRCPGCNTKALMNEYTDFAKLNKVLLRVYHDFSIVCKCGFVGDLVEMDGHELMRCPRRMVKCPNKNCRVTGRASRLEATHFQHCGHYVLKCAKCELSVRPDEQATHDCITALKYQLQGTYPNSIIFILIM